MNRKAGLLALLLLGITWSAFSQKIKYKDLMVLLNAKQFEEAEPYLKKYLRDNDDNPNAFLFMGMIYQEKSGKLDVLKQTDQMLSQIDSAVLWYEKAKAGITEKEVSKNDEYYQIYNRRDLRTGKFGVTLSDVQLDIENRLKLKEKAKLVRSLKSAFVLSQQRYERARSQFTAISNAYPSKKELYLRVDEQLTGKLKSLEQAYDSVLMAFNDYHSLLQQMGKTGYNQDIHPVDIVDFKKDGLSPADFYHDDLKVWDYKRWSAITVESIEKDVVPLKDLLVAIDVEINKLQQKIKKDSVSVSSEVPAIRAKMVFPALHLLDPHPMPLRLFDMKLAELVYGSQVSDDRVLRDSANIMLQMKGLEKEMKLARQLDSLAKQIDMTSFDEDVENYKGFVTTAFGTPAVLKSLISATRDFASRELAARSDRLRKKVESLRWIVDATDSIPLFMEASPGSKFRPMIVKEESFTAGLLFKDTLSTGYFYAILGTRKPAVKAAFEVDKLAFTKKALPFAKAIGTQDEMGHVYFVLYYSEVKVNNKFPATIVKVYHSDGLSWAVNAQVDNLPEELVYAADTGELTVKTRGSGGDVVPVVFDKAGKLK